MTPSPPPSLPKFSMFFQPEPSSSRTSGGSRETQTSYHHHESGASSSSSTTSSPEHQAAAVVDATTRQFASSSAYSTRHHRRPFRGADQLEQELATRRSRTPSFGGMSVVSPTDTSARKVDLPSAAMPPSGAATVAHHQQGTTAGLAQAVAESHRIKRAQREDSVVSPPPEQPVQRERISRYLSEGDRRNIISRIDKGEKQVSLAKEYGVSRAAICNLYKNRKVVLTRVDRDPDAKHPKKQKHNMISDASSPNVDPELRRDSEDSMHEVVLDSQQLQHLQLARERYQEEVQQQQQEMQRHQLRHQMLQHQHLHQRQQEVVSRRKQQPFRVHEASSYSYPIQHLLSALRDATTPPQSFRHNANRLMRLLIEDALTCLPVQPKELKTTLGDSCAGVHTMPQQAVCAISMEGNSGSVLLRAFSDIYPESPAGMVSLENHVLDASGANGTWMVRAQFPCIDPSRQVVMLLDTRCATGERACAVLRHLIQELGVPPSSIYFVSVIASTAGLRRIYDLFPGKWSVVHIFYPC